MASLSSAYQVTCAHAPLALLPRPTRRPDISRITLAGISRGGRASAPLFLSPGACRLGGARRHRGSAQICRDASFQGPPDGDSAAQEQEDKKSEEVAASARIASGSGGGGKLSDWTTSVLIFGIWAGLMYYIFQLAPNQTPVRDSIPWLASWYALL